MKAVVPVAFFTPEHVAMTDSFLAALRPEVEAVRVYLNSDEADGLPMLGRHDVEVYPAEGWPFYEMWNHGIAWAADTCVVTNNDITWPPGAIEILGRVLENQPEDVAICSPDPNVWVLSPGPPEDVEPTPAYRGLLGWCFTIRGHLWPDIGPIDTRYRTWYGDDELGRLVTKAGYRCVRATGVPVFHETPETTTRYIPGVKAMREADRVLYEEKWG